MSATFTPGPWHCSGGGFSDHGGVDYTLHATDMVISKANARLIAAAPDLLAALTVSLNWIVDLVNSGDAGFWNPEDMPEVKQARAAIARATGVA